jgi:hypothetical protein
MKTAPKTQQKQGDYSSLSTAKLLTVIAEKETRLSVQSEQTQARQTLKQTTLIILLDYSHPHGASTNYLSVVKTITKGRV